MFEVVKHLDADELAEWRRDRDTVTASGSTTPTEPVTKVNRKYVKPLGAAETQEAVKGFLWDNMTKDRDTYAAAVRWMRRRVPGLSHKTDVELMEYLDKTARESTQQVLGAKGLLGRLHQ